MIRRFVQCFPGYTSCYIAKDLNIGVAYVSSFLNKEYKAGRIKRTPGKGPRGGYVWG